VEFILFAYTAVKLNERDPHILAGNAFSEKWRFGVYNKVRWFI
jgi:hypothetical protein